MLTVTYPPDKAVEFTKGLIESLKTPLPPFIKRWHMLTTVAGEPGLKGYGIYEVEVGREHEAFQEIVKRMISLHSIEGLRYQIEPAMTAEEAIPLLGLEMP